MRRLLYEHFKHRGDELGYVRPPPCPMLHVLGQALMGNQNRFEESTYEIVSLAVRRESGQEHRPRAGRDADERRRNGMWSTEELYLHGLMAFKDKIWICAEHTSRRKRRKDIAERDPPATRHPLVDL